MDRCPVWALDSQRRLSGRSPLAHGRCPDKGKSSQGRDAKPGEPVEEPGYRRSRVWGQQDHHIVQSFDIKRFSPRLARCISMMEVIAVSGSSLPPSHRQSSGVSPDLSWAFSTRPGQDRSGAEGCRLAMGPPERRVGLHGDPTQLRLLMLTTTTALWTSQCERQSSSCVASRPAGHRATPKAGSPAETDDYAA